MRKTRFFSLLLVFLLSGCREMTYNSVKYPWLGRVFGPGFAAEVTPLIRENLVWSLEEHTPGEAYRVAWKFSPLPVPEIWVTSNLAKGSMALAARNVSQDQSQPAAQSTNFEVIDGI